MLGVTDVLLQSGVKFTSTIRSQGNQIARQRDRLINHWYDSKKADWLLWVDSDVVISPETFRLLWNNKDRLAELGKGDSFLGEDIYFFALCHQIGIPLWCHTGALAPHMKRFSFDVHYYNAIFGGKKNGNNTSMAEESGKES